MNINTATVYSLIRPASLWKELPLLIGFNLIMVATAYISINLPFSPVPITGQTFGVMLIAMALGRLRAVGVITAYLLEGLAGLPVFAGGTAGPAIIAGPTGGYLFGFLVSAYIVGSLADRGWDKSYSKSILAMFLGHAVIFTFGLAALSLFVPKDSVLTMGLYPFLSGTLVKIILAAVILPSVWKFIKREQNS
jgi:biotin transport system substrate-specific component